MLLQKGEIYSKRIVEILEPHCSVINIAGSIRRKKTEVKDIEIVAIPKKIFIPYDLFEKERGYSVPIAGFVNALTQFTDTVVKGKPDGRYMQIKVKGDETLDLFMPQEEDYFRQFAIRTGSADFSQKVIAAAWVRNGWVGTHNGLRKRIDCVQTLDSSTWNLSNPEPELPPIWDSEQDFFKWLQIDYVKPENRI